MIPPIGNVFTLCSSLLSGKQTRGRGRKAVITPVKSVANVCLNCVEMDG